MTRGVSAASYVRAVERHWSRLAGRPVVLSPRDWAHLSRWHQQGVPLELIREAMDAAAERKPGAEPFRSLAALGRAIEESFGTVVDGRLRGNAAGDEPAATGSGALRWRELIERPATPAPLAALLADLLRRFESGEPAESLDAELERRLPETVGRRRVEALREALEEQLRPFRERLGEAQHAEALRRGVLERLRREIGIPRLARAREGD